MRGRGPGSRRRIGVAAAAVAVIAGCSSSSSPAVPASPLTAGRALTCPGRAKACTAPGTVRWSVPLSGPSGAEIDSGGSVLNLPAATAAGTSFGDVPAGYLATVTVAPGLVVFQQPGHPVVGAIDPATGKRLWTTKLPVPAGFTPDSAVSGPYPLHIVAAGGEVAVYDTADYLWWLVGAATGQASPPHRLASYSQVHAPATADVLPVTSQSAVLLNSTQVQGADPATGSVRWQVPLLRWTGYTVIGNVLYADNDPYGQDASGNTGPSGRASAIQRVDLSTGRVLPALPLPRDLDAEGGDVVQFGADPGALLVEAGAVLARIDPATGHPMWTATLPARTSGGAQAGPTGTPPTVEYLLPGQGTDTAQPSRPGTGTDIWQVLVVSLATGKITTVTLGRSVPYSSAGFDVGESSGIAWNLFGPAILAGAPAKAEPAGNGGFVFTRLEGVSPQTGKVLWRGPWAGDLWVLGETVTGPPVVIAESCSPGSLATDPSAIHGDQALCNSERLYAVNG